MFRKLLTFHKDLVTPTSKVSSSRYIALGAFYVSSWMLMYLTWKTTILPSEIFFAYIATFAASYLGGKGLAVLSEKKQDDSDK